MRDTNNSAGIGKVLALLVVRKVHLQQFRLNWGGRLARRWPLVLTILVYSPATPPTRSRCDRLDERAGVQRGNTYTDATQL